MHIDHEMNEAFNAGWFPDPDNWFSLDWYDYHNPDVIHFASKKVVYRKGGKVEDR